MLGVRYGVELWLIVRGVLLFGETRRFTGCSRGKLRGEMAWGEPGAEAELDLTGTRRVLAPRGS